MSNSRRHAQNWASPFTPTKSLNHSPPKRVNMFDQALGTLASLVAKVQDVSLRGELEAQVELLLKHSDQSGTSSLEARLGVEMQQMRLFLKNEMLEMHRNIQSSSKGASASYSDVVQVKLRTKQVTVNQEEKVVLVYPDTFEGEEGEASKKTREAVRAAVAPKASGLQITEVRNVRKGGIAVVVKNSTQAEDLKKGLSDLQKGGFKVQESKGMKPRVRIFDVPSSISKEELQDCVFGQNVKDLMGKDEFNKGFVPLFSSKPIKANERAEEKVNWVIVCSPGVRSLLVKKEKIGIDWFLCKVRDFNSVTRCFKCNGFGHMASSCMYRERCGKCAEEGHQTKACKSTSSPKCANCKRFGKPHDHDVRDGSCPCYARAIEQQLRRTNYAE